MTYKRDMAEVFVLLGLASYVLIIIGGTIFTGVIVAVLGYWYVGIPMIIGGIFLVPTAGKIGDRLFKWYYEVDKDK